ncbi:hypothetical protein CK203_085345 [Vitis vinifera]|uniref:Uncharacterized protein n=1 Tax=Vitis vinifera TaxID=29760 RepID=A0A438DCX6_VITVI|nr:hypothetical protein CK203_085345 [Vitis vinifera]
MATTMAAASTVIASGLPHCPLLAPLPQRGHTRFRICEGPSGARNPLRQAKLVEESLLAYRPSMATVSPAFSFPALEPSSLTSLLDLLSLLPLVVDGHMAPWSIPLPYFGQIGFKGRTEDYF